MPIPDNITASDILSALKSVDSGVDLVPTQRRSTGYCLEHPGAHFRHFPPKEILRIANRARNGTELEHFRGGPESNDFCKARGIDWVPCRGRAPH